MRDRSASRTTRRGGSGAASHGPAHGASHRGGDGRDGRDRDERDRDDRGQRPDGRSGLNPMASVAFITLAALVGVGILAIQANGSAPKVSNNSAAAQHPEVTSLSPSGTAQVPVTVDPLKLPADSGSGLRIVYSLAGKRIWLVGSDGTTVQRTAEVVPGTVAPPKGAGYKVTSRTSSQHGQDGTSVQYVVIFGHVNGTSFGFDAVYGVSGLPPAPTGTTGGIRMSQDDALAVWQFTSVNTPVVVVS